MFFGLQPLKQNSTIGGGSGVNSYARTMTDIQPSVSPKPTAVDPAKTTADAKLQLSNEVIVTEKNGVSVEAGRQVTTVVADARRRFNEAVKNGDMKAAKNEWKRAERTFNAANQLGYLEKGANGYVQNAATYLGVGYDKIQVKTPTTAGTPPVKPESTQAAETNNVTGTETIDASNNTPAAVDPQVVEDCQKFTSQMANVQDKQQQLELATVALSKAKPDEMNAAEAAVTKAKAELEAANRERGTTLGDMGSRYDDGLIGTSYKDMKKLGEFKNNPALDQVVQDVARLTNKPVSEVQDTTAFAVLTGLSHAGKNNPAAKELAERLLASLQKPVAASQTSSSSDVPAPESETVPATEQA